MGQERVSSEVETSADLPHAPSAYVGELLQNLARDQGQTALLTGQGGDQWFNPNPLYPSELLRRGSMVEAARTARRLSPAASPPRAFSRHLARPVLAGWARQAVPGLRIGAATRPTPEWISPELASRSALGQRLHPPSTRPRTSAAARALHCDSGWEAAFFETTALMDVRSGVSTRHPFYDSRLIAFALGLDESQRWADGQARTIQRRAMVGRLPEQVRLRTSKGDAGHLFVQQFEAAGGRDRFASLAIVHDAGWLSQAGVLHLYDEFARDTASGRASGNLGFLWMALAVESWFSGVVVANAC
jgi:asparagine synthetase B (glutamine-hydrolysing)